MESTTSTTTLEICKFCKKSKSTVVDDMCDSCEEAFMDQLSISASLSCPETLLSDLFASTQQALIHEAKLEEMLHENENENESVRVFVYPWGADRVKYIFLGTFEVVNFNGIKEYRNVACTLQRGKKGNMRRIGIHNLIHSEIHNLIHSEIPGNLYLPKLYAKEVVAGCVSAFRENINKEKYSAETLRVAEDWLATA